MSSVILLDAGGTISSEPGHDGVLIAGRQGLSASLAPLFLAGMAQRSVYAGLSEDMSLADAMEVVGACDGAIRDGASAVIVAHGTDTMEDVAFLADLFHAGPEPILFTGAQRAASLPGADGPANLRDAAIVARTPAARGIGAAIVFGGRIFPARSARKLDSSAPDAFGPASAVIGRVDGHGARIFALPRRRPALPRCSPDTDIPIVTLGIGGGVPLFDAIIESGARAMVIEGFGCGNVPMRLLPAIERARTHGMLVGLASNCVSGGTASTYQSGARLASLGIISGADLSARKLRLLLAVALGDGRNEEEADATCRAWLAEEESTSSA